MKVKKIPIRTCIITKEKLPKKDLIRIVRTPEGKFEVDLTGKKNGRGVYLKNDIDVFDKAQKNKIFNKVFECIVDDQIYEELRRLKNE